MKLKIGAVCLLCFISFGFLLTIHVSGPIGVLGLTEKTNGDGQAGDTHLTFDKYHHYDDLMKLFKGLQADYPNLARTDSIGMSVDGRNLQYIEITHQVNSKTPGRPKVKLIGNMHGDETVGREMLIYLSQHLLHTYTTDKQSQDIVNNMRLFIMPSINPDGFEHSTEGSCETPFMQKTSRENSNRKDLNRNFPDQFDPLWKKKGQKFETETKAMMDWIQNNK